MHKVKTKSTSLANTVNGFLMVKITNETLCITIRALVESSKIDLGIYLNTESSDIYQDEFLKVAKTDKGFRPTLLLIPTRLGHDMVTMVYWEALKSVLTMPQCMGIAG